VGEYFAGRLVIFTHTRKFSVGVPPRPKPDFDNVVLGTIVHEFLHAFGMPHKCGNRDWKTPRLTSCCMNYFDTWLVTGGALQPNTVNQLGDTMCARHLMEVRRTHLDRNPALHW
jgi:hypothetical protein